MHKDYFFIKLEIYPYLIVSRQDEDALTKKSLPVS